MTTWLNDKHFDYIEVIVIVALVMFTKYVGILKGTVNGATTTMIVINHSDIGQVSSIKISIDLYFERNGIEKVCVQTQIQI